MLHNLTEMKNAHLLLISFSILISNILVAKPTDKKTIIKWNFTELVIPLAFASDSNPSTDLYSSITIGVEHVVKPWASIQGNFSFINRTKPYYYTDSAIQNPTIFSGNMSTLEIGLNVEFRYYVKRHAPTGFYFGPYITYKSYFVSIPGTLHNDYQSEQYTIKFKPRMLGIGTIAGYQIVFKDIFSLDFNAGFGYYSISNATAYAVKSDRSTIQMPNKDTSGPLPVLGVSFGIAL